MSDSVEAQLMEAARQLRKELSEMKPPYMYKPSVAVVHPGWLREMDAIFQRLTPEDPTNGR